MRQRNGDEIASGLEIGESSAKLLHGKVESSPCPESECDRAAGAENSSNSSAERNAELEMQADAKKGLALKPYSYLLIRGVRSIGLACKLRDCIFAGTLWLSICSFLRAHC